nr:hypothetical protein [Tanacetum cinerariifolium]
MKSASFMVLFLTILRMNGNLQPKAGIPKRACNDKEYGFGVGSVDANVWVNVINNSDTMIKIAIINVHLIRHRFVKRGKCFSYARPQHKLVRVEIINLSLEDIVMDLDLEV